MQRLAGFLFATAMLAGACSSKSDSSKSDSSSEKPEPVAKGSAAGSAAPAAPATPMALVQQWGAANLHVPVEGLHVAPPDVKASGVELYWVSDGRPESEADGDAASQLVGVVGGVTGKIVEGRELLLAVIAGKPAAKDLARIALGVAQRDGDVLDKAEGPEQQKAKVTPPATKGNTLSFWVYTREVPRSLEHGQLDLTTGVLALAPPPGMSKDPLLSWAIATLNGPTVKRHAAAAGVLVENCKEPRAIQALNNAVAGHPRAKTRVSVMEQIHRCGAPAVNALVAALDEDKSSVARQAAAVALGRIGDGKARAALAKASRSEDANLAYAAKTALGKLK